MSPRSKPPRRKRAATPAPTDWRSTKADKDEAPQGRVAQIKAVWAMTRKEDPRAIPLILGPALIVLAALVVVGVLIGQIVTLTIIGVLAALIVGMTIFGRRATATMYKQVEGKPGAAAAVLQGMRGDWRVTPAVGFTRNQELVHRVVGRPGVILIGEGNSTAAIRQLITDQKRRIGRVAPEIPIHDLIVGDEDDRVPVRKLQSQVMKLPRSLRKSEVNALEARMKALGGPNVPLPKGPVPTRMPRRQMR